MCVSGSVAVSGEKVSRSWFSTGGPIDEEGLEEDFEETIERPELQPHGVDPRKGWGFRGVHRVITTIYLIYFTHKCSITCFCQNPIEKKESLLCFSIPNHAPRVLVVDVFYSDVHVLAQER